MSSLKSYKEVAELVAAESKYRGRPANLSRSCIFRLHILRAVLLTAFMHRSAPKFGMIEHSFHCLLKLPSGVGALRIGHDPRARRLYAARSHIGRDWDAIYEDVRINLQEWYLYFRNISH